MARPRTQRRTDRRRAAQADPTIISARGLAQSLDASGHGRTVLDGLGVDIRRGDFTVIMGPSGAGKSTLLYALALAFARPIRKVSPCGLIAR